MRLSSLLYGLARRMRDANAISRGPEAIGKRLMRKSLYRLAGSIINRLIR